MGGWYQPPPSTLCVTAGDKSSWTLRSSTGKAERKLHFPHNHGKFKAGKTGGCRYCLNNEDCSVWSSILKNQMILH